MKYYIAADGGGSKLQIVLYDENLNIINASKTYGTNPNFKSLKLIKEDIYQAIEKLLPDDVSEIERVDMSVSNSVELFLENLSRKCCVKQYYTYDEGSTALAAAGVRYGVVAQSGTGSDAFLLQQNVFDYVGGWGAMLGDEGSGYDIGIKTLKSIIYAYDGRGKETILLEMLKKEWHLNNLIDIIAKLSGTPEYRRKVAEVTLLTAEAAKQGDPVAIEIYENAAYDMAHQVLTIIKKHNGWQGPIIASGGTWKGYPGMFETFCKNIRKVLPEVEIRRAIYEPVIGCIILKCFDDGKEFDDIEATLSKQFSDFLIS